MYRLPLLLALAGCEALGLACTEMGCIGTLTIFLSRPLADGALVTATVDGETVDCPPGDEVLEGCILTTVDGEAAIQMRTGGTAWEMVDLDIDEGGGPATYQVNPTWGDRWFPNGEACDGPDGGCVSGEADLAL